MKKKLFAALLAAVCLCGCGSSTSKSDRKKIVVTVFPEYDWVNEILRDNPSEIKVILLTESGADLHSFQPTAEDIMNISTSDLFVCIGGESDQWVDDAVKESVNQDQTVIRLMDALGDRAKEEEHKEGMMEEEHEEAEAEEYDEHIWLSLKNAQVLLPVLEEAIVKIDPDNRSLYESNTQAYLSSLNELDQEYETELEQTPYNTLLFGDRFPFRYLVEDYGLDYYAAFSGCSGETEASFETVLFLASKVDELHLKHVMKIEGSDGKIARTIIENTTDKNQDILTLNSMQGVTGADVRNGVTYLGIMKDNLAVLKEALR